jgi:glycogen operon protein
MLCHGDELGRTQQGNNNAYCQDNEISWVDWELTDEQRRLAEFTRHLIALRAAHPVLRRRRFFRGETATNDRQPLPDLMWLRPDAREMTDRDWQRGDAHSVGVFLNGDAIAERDAYGRRMADDSFLLLVNGYWEPVDFRLPDDTFGECWTTLVDTADPDGVPDERERKAGTRLRVEARSLVLLSRPSRADG